MPNAVHKRWGRSENTWAGIVAAIAVHATILGTVHAVGVKQVDGFGALKQAVDEPELKSGCVGDAMLAATARYSLCLAPWQSDADACLGEARVNMWIDLSSCDARDERGIAQVAMVGQKATDQIKPIDPEPLIEMMKEQQQPKVAAVPPPQPQQQQPPAPPPPQARQ